MRWSSSAASSSTSCPPGFQKVRHYGFLSPNSGTALEAVRWLVTLYNRVDLRPGSHDGPRDPTHRSSRRAALLAAVDCSSWDSCRRGYRRPSTRVNLMVEVSRFPTGFHTRSASRGPIAVRADVGFPSLCGPPRADQSVVQSTPARCHRRVSRGEPSTASHSRRAPFLPHTPS